jgi:hypothetical protein
MQRPNRGTRAKGHGSIAPARRTATPVNSKQRCCPNAVARKVPHDLNEDARDVARAIAATPEYEQSRHRRKKVEMLFAHLKRILRVARLRLRGPCGAREKFLLAATAKTSGDWPNSDHKGRCTALSPHKSGIKQNLAHRRRADNR